MQIDIEISPNFTESQPKIVFDKILAQRTHVQELEALLCLNHQNVY